MIRVRYFYSACVSIETPDLSILCDPWFTDGIYDGSWYQYPKLADPLEKISACDYVYISHIHPDHYDPLFLREYLKKHPRTKVIIADFKPNYLSKKMTANGFKHEVVSSFSIGTSKVDLICNESDPSDVDSALIVRRGPDSVVNLNDNLYNPSLVDKVKALCGNPTIALLAYTGAGPYPQTYFSDGPMLLEKAKRKKEDFFERYRTMAAALGARVNIPFAGKYILGGKLHRLNANRGMADAVEVTGFDECAVVLDDGGDATIDTESLVPSRIRTKAYDATHMERYAESFAKNPMAYETFFAGLPFDQVPWGSILRKAYLNAVGRSYCDADYYFCISMGENYFVMNANKEKNECLSSTSVDAYSPRSVIEIDYRYLFGLVSGVFHWNNAEIGSQLQVRRTPDIFNRSAQSFLNFFHL